MGLFLPEILLPNPGIDLEKWAVIACDQFTQDRGYWEKVKNTVGGMPSALNLIYPEAYLSDADRGLKIENIRRTMARYLADGVFAQARTGCVYVERNTPLNTGRRGLVIAVDLEHYDWKTGAQRLIRCTEGTLPERLPPRMDVRRNAALETSHILLLIDDEQDRLLPRLAERAKSRAPAYNSALMKDSGDISGWFLDSADDWEFIAEELEELARRTLIRDSAASDEKITANAENGAAAPFLFAAGDGNHSLATAKEIWEEYKKNHFANAGNNSTDGLPVHPCRYAMVEIENLYDPAVRFEPIHRVLFGIDSEKALALLSQLPDFSGRLISSPEELAALVKEQTDKNRFGLIAHNSAAGKHESCRMLIETSARGLATVRLQPLLDRWLEQEKLSVEQNGGQVPYIDYIHGEKELFRLTAQPINARMPAAGILLPPIKKSGFFETVARSGPLPRKSFSMGGACEKRFYLECRKLF